LHPFCFGIDPTFPVRRLRRRQDRNGVIRAQPHANAFGDARRFAFSDSFAFAGAQPFTVAYSFANAGFRPISYSYSFTKSHSQSVAYAHSLRSTSFGPCGADS
jgi:hypothetical protein